jgi:hypothetical protein
MGLQLERSLPAVAPGDDTSCTIWAEIAHAGFSVGPALRGTWVSHPAINM